MMEMDESIESNEVMFNSAVMQSDDEADSSNENGRGMNNSCQATLQSQGDMPVECKLTLIGKQIEALMSKVDRIERHNSVLDRQPSQISEGATPSSVDRQNMTQSDNCVRTQVNNDLDQDVRLTSRSARHEFLDSESQTDRQYDRSGRQVVSGTYGVQSRTSQQSLKMRPHQYDGHEDLEEYLAQFEIISEINGWSYAHKSLYLAGSLKGSALAMLSELSDYEKRDYNCLVDMLRNRYGSANRAEMFRARLHTRVKTKDESLAELSQSVRKLTRQAYPGAPQTLIDILSLDKFIDAIPDMETRLRIREARPRDIIEAESIATRLESHRLAEKQRGHSVRMVESLSSKPEKSNTSTDKEMQAIKQSLSVLTKQMSNLSQQMSSASRANTQNRPNERFYPTHGHNGGRGSHHGNSHTGYHGNHDSHRDRRNGNANRQQYQNNEFRQTSSQGNAN